MSICLRRRDFIAGLGGAAAWPLAARAQQRPVVGYLGSRTQGEAIREVADFRDGLRETGFAEGVNLTVEYRWANNDNARLPDLAADLMRRNVAVCVTISTPATRAAKAATQTIPIVFSGWRRSGRVRIRGKPGPTGRQSDRRDLAL